MCLVIAFVFMILLGVAFYYLPGWSWLIILPIGAIALWFARGHVFLYLFSIPFRMKGKVLRNAAVTVHSVQPVTKPELLERAEQEQSARAFGKHEASDGESVEEFEDEPVKPIVWPRYYEMEVTITPKSPTGSFRLWAPHDLQLIPPRANPMNDAGDACEILNVKVHPPADLTSEETAKFEEGSKFFGPLRLTILVGVASEIKTLAFHYYFRKFGKVEFPSAPLTVL